MADRVKEKKIERGLFLSDEELLFARWLISRIAWIPDSHADQITTMQKKINGHLGPPPPPVKGRE